MRPPEKRTNSALRKAGGTAAALAVVAAKFKALLGLLFAFKWVALAGKLLLSSSTILVSVWFYALAFGWKLAIVFVLLILVHEVGHVVVLRGYGVRVSLPYFIPGLGAFVSMQQPQSAAQEAYGALAGPIFGTAAAAACYGYGLATENRFWIAAAYIGFFLNLFNLFPVLPLDGGRVAGAISPRLWLLGLAGFFAFIVATHRFSAFLLLIVLFLIVPSIPRAIGAWRGERDPRFEALTLGERASVATAYFALLAVLVVGMIATRSEPRGGPAPQRFAYLQISARGGPSPTTSSA